ncbi:MAG: ATP-binding protein [bacterium]|nr:ATP-binding protein [bacterium]
MFRSARLKLTAYYLLIIMTISVLFSVVVYRNLTVEIARGMRVQALRILARDESGSRQFIFGLPVPLQPNELPPNFHVEAFEEAKKRVALELMFINLGILLVSGASGYFLAGKTLKPISEMVEEQRRFVADASHELRTPLTVMKTETEVLLRDKNLDLSQAKEQLTSNLEEIDKLKSLTDYFLTLSRYQNTEAKLPLETIDLAEVVGEACERLSALAKEKKIAIVQNLQRVKVKANRVSLGELVSILLDNALKYSHENGQVKVSVEAKKNQAMIKIEDSGIGIKSSDLPFVFNRFYRADSSRTKENVKGYGLGLAIAKSIVDLHQGKMTVESVVDKGSTFTVLLPA